MKIFTLSSALIFALSVLASACDQSQESEMGLQLYAMDCGSIDVDDMSSFSSDGTFDGQQYSLVVPCYLIRHSKGDLLWDTGFDQSLIETPDGLRGGGFHSTVSVRLTDQLQMLGLDPDDIDYVSVSHSHPDHIGNAGLFKKSTFVISAAEFSYMFSDEARGNAERIAPYAHLESADVIKYDEEYDLFGDGLVVMKTLPGHTPGSAILQLTLENAGVVLLTGDLITHAAGRDVGAIPAFNTDIEKTRSSLVRFEELANAKDARVIIQHEPADFEALPIFPSWLD